MERRSFLRTLGLGTLWLSASGVMGVVRPAGASPPNILILVSDDHGKEDTGCYGNPVVKTPNIYRIAQQGMRFHRAFTSTAMCAPSRSTLYTGLHPHRHGCHMNHGGVRTGIKSIPQYLEPLGYRVGLAGKRHINPVSAFPFEYMDLEPEQIADFIRADGSSPFCVIVATNDPHAERIEGHRGFRPSTRYEPEAIPLPLYLVDTQMIREQRAGYYDLITRLDDFVGRIIEVLRETRSEEKTLLIYTSDHGSPFPFEKWTCYEAGLNVPFLVRWPGQIPAGTESAALISFVDMLPTLIDIAGGDPPRDLDGSSFRNVLTGETAEHHEYVYGAHTTEGINHGSYYPVRSIRSTRYKYIRNLHPDGRFTNNITAGRLFQAGWSSWKEQAKLDPFAARRVRLYQKRPPEELYDLHHDPYEMYNLIDDAAYQEVRASLSRRLHQWMIRQQDAELENWQVIGS